MIVALVLLSAFLHAGWNALLRVEPDLEEYGSVISWVQIPSDQADRVARLEERVARLED